MTSYEVRDDHAEHAPRNVDDVLRRATRPTGIWCIADVADYDGDRGRPRRARHAGAVGGARRGVERRWSPGGVLIIYVATVTQLSQDGGGDARTAVLDRAAVMGDPAARLERRRPGGAPAAHMRGHTAFLISARATWRRAPSRRRRCAASASSAAASDRGASSRRAAPQPAPRREQLDLRPRGHQPFGGVEHVDHMRAVAGHHRNARCRPAGADRASRSRRRTRVNVRCNSATIGRTTERFCLSECTSPSSRSNSSQPIHMLTAVSGSTSGVSVGWGGGTGGGWADLASPNTSSMSAVCRVSCQAPWSRAELHRER